MTLIEGLLTVLVLLAGAVVVGLVRADRALRAAAADVRTLVKAAGSTARVTSVHQPEARDRVHLVLMDRGERNVDYVMVIDPAQRAHTVTYGPHAYTCISGSVAEGHFVYRRA